MDLKAIGRRIKAAREVKGLTQEALAELDIFDAFQFGVGDEIMVYKANQIIPQIAENKTKSGTFKMPMVCPCCGEKLIVRTTPGGSRQMYCENP